MNEARPIGSDAGSIRDRVTDEVTRLIAAQILCDSRFPDPNLLPRAAPIPFSNAGHYVMSDYGRLCAILWGVAEEIQRALRANPWYYLSPVLAAITGVFVAIFAVVASESPAGLIPGVVIGILIYTLTAVRVEKIAARVRADAIRSLLAGKLPPEAQEWEKRYGGRMVAWGNVDLSAGCPVLLLTNDDDPFPGFGVHHARQLFVCRPAPETPFTESTPNRVNAEVIAAIEGLAGAAGIAGVTTGFVVVLDGRTLRKNSPWLGATSRESLVPTRHMPPLAVPSDELNRVLNTDPHASARVYACVQVVIPQYLTCLTFFVRSFMAGSSAACEVNVCTLGPPVRDWNSIRERLATHEREVRGHKPEPVGQDHAGMSAKLAALRLAQRWGWWPFCAQSLPGVTQLDPFDPEAKEQESEQAVRLAKEMLMWPGLFTAPGNWREWFSTAFTNDFFGNTESRAIVQTLYDRICRGVLGRLKTLGYDVSDYQDSSGNFIINAEKIDQLITGESVTVERGEREGAKEKGKPKKKKKQAEGNAETASAAEGEA